jgi:2-polyprenyl-3-methyl-5-hydroxy-6-metoxy-1,4-benzoquinol methylase
MRPTPYAHAVSEQRTGASGEVDWEAAYDGDIPSTPVDRDIVAVVSDLPPGRALDLGCGAGQNSIWLAQRGWRVHGVDIAGGAIERAEADAARAGVEATFERADVTGWRTSERFDLVISTYALPPRGPGRVHALAVARDAVAPGGLLLLAEFEAALAESGWMTAEHLVELDELTEALPGFELEAAEVKVTAHGHGGESRELPIACVVARHPGPLSVEA